MELWKSINGYEGWYEVSSFGRLRRVKAGVRTQAGKILKPSPDTDGYLIVHLCKEGKVSTFRVNRLVAKTFIENPENLPEVNHLNQNRADNSINNLEWCTPVYNVRYSSKLSYADVEAIRWLYSHDGFTHQRVADEFGISRSQVGRIVRKENWKDTCTT